MTQARPKGNAGEREVARLLASWWGALEPGAEFVRTPSSGGWSTPIIRAAFSASGDIMTTAQLFPFEVEVKRREKWTLENLIEGKRSPVWSWWRQTLKAAAEGSREPMLWFRQSRKTWLVMLREQLAPSIGALCIWHQWHEPYGLGVDDGGVRPLIVHAHVLLKLEPSCFALRRIKKTA
jgi:Holliday junction resolvase